MSTEHNVVDMKAYKELVKARESKEAFEKYLKTLDQGQLDTEVTYLLDNDSKNDLFSRGQMIMKEISNRAHKLTKKKIDKFTLNLVTE